MASSSFRPYRVLVNSLKPTGNRVTVEVTSVTANRIPRPGPARGCSGRPSVTSMWWILNYKPFNAANWPLTDCGLLGPVTLKTVVKDKLAAD